MTLEALPDGFIRRLSNTLIEPFPSESWWIDRGAMERYHYKPGMWQHIRVKDQRFGDNSWLCRIGYIKEDRMCGEDGFRAFWDRRVPVVPPVNPYANS